MLTQEDSKRVADALIKTIFNLNIDEAIKMGIVRAFEGPTSFPPDYKTIVERAIRQGIENGMRNK